MIFFSSRSSFCTTPGTPKMINDQPHKCHFSSHGWKNRPLLMGRVPYNLHILYIQWHKWHRCKCEKQYFLNCHASSWGSIVGIGSVFYKSFCFACILGDFLVKMKFSSFLFTEIGDRILIESSIIDWKEITAGKQPQNFINIWVKCSNWQSDLQCPLSTCAQSADKMLQSIQV